MLPSITLHNDLHSRQITAAASRRRSVLPSIIYAARRVLTAEKRVRQVLLHITTVLCCEVLIISVIVYH